MAGPPLDWPSLIEVPDESGEGGLLTLGLLLDALDGRLAVAGVIPADPLPR